MSWCSALELSKDSAVWGTVLARHSFFLDEIIDDNACHVTEVWEISWLLEIPKLKQGVDSSHISMESGQSKDVLVVVIDTAHHKLGIDCDDALVTNLISTRVRYSYNWTPEDVVRLSSGLSFNLLILLWHGHLSVNTISHMKEISSGAGQKKEQWLSFGYFCWRDE